MRITQPEEPSTLKAALVAPAVTPVVALPLVALLPYAYTTPYALFAIPVTIILALIYGYLGMFLVCLPIFLLLRLANRVDAIRLCAYTTALGALIWTWYYQWDQSLEITALTRYWIVGAGSSLAVSACFCWLNGITIRSTGRSPAARVRAG